MKDISFKVSGLKTGDTYRAELYLDGVLKQTQNNVTNGLVVTYIVTEPGDYAIKVVSNTNAMCVQSAQIQALFPLFSFNVTSVDCSNNTATFIVTLINPTTAGTGVQYGWSTFNDCSTVTNWQTNGAMIVAADSVTRYFFIKNDSACCNPVSSYVGQPCLTCDIVISNIVFRCNG